LLSSSRSPCSGWDTRFGLYAHRAVDGLQALFAMEMSILAILWFGFRLKDDWEDEVISIRQAEPIAGRQSERRSEWKLSEEKAA